MLHYDNGFLYNSMIAAQIIRANAQLKTTESISTAQNHRVLQAIKVYRVTITSEQYVKLIDLPNLERIEVNRSTLDLIIVNCPRLKKIDFIAPQENISISYQNQDSI